MMNLVVDKVLLMTKIELYAEKLKIMEKIMKIPAAVKKLKKKQQPLKLIKVNICLSFTTPISFMRPNNGHS